MSSKQTSSETEKLQQGETEEGRTGRGTWTTGAEEEEEEEDEDEEEQQQWEQQRDTRGRQVAIVSHPNRATKNNPQVIIFQNVYKKQHKKTQQNSTNMVAVMLTQRLVQRRPSLCVPRIQISAVSLCSRAFFSLYNQKQTLILL